MQITPDSTINLYSNVEIDNGEQLAFSSVANQNAYFQQHLAHAYTPCTVVRKTGALRVEIGGAYVSNCNYISFINPAFDDKIIYARIIDYDYVNNECTEITYAIDYWQTWMFDVTYEASFIEREHLSEADWDRADANPYDPNIFELRTNENLPIGKDIEKAEYVIGTGANADGSKLGDIIGIDPHLGVLIKIANIDFADLDAGISVMANRPSYKFAQYLNQVVNGSGVYSFYYITQSMQNYLVANYPSLIPTDRYALNSGWSIQGGTVYPFYGSSYRPQCCYIYDSLGGEMAANYMGNFLEMMTTFTGGDPGRLIIDMTLIPNNIMFLGGRLDDGTSLSTLMFGVNSAKTLNVVNHKLMRYPYSYGRLISPNGDIKEFKFEDFINIQHNEDIGYMSMLLDISDKPVFIVAPVNYKISGINSENTNILECLYFDQFPTMPYTIDAFTAQVAAIANATIGNRTTDSAADMANWDVQSDEISQNIGMFQKIVNSVGSGVSSATSALEAGMPAGLGGVLSAVGAAGSAMSSYGMSAEMSMNRKKFEQARDRWHDADSALVDADGSTIANQLRLTKPAYACDKYFPSNGIGTTNFTVVSFCDIISLCVNLQPAILNIYDDYFTLYGYNSGRCGIPHVVSYVVGSSNQDELPHWATLGGNKQITYIKTIDMKISYSMVPVASYN